MFCPICETEALTFLTIGSNGRKNAECPACGSYERHRFLWVILSLKCNVLDNQPQSILEVGPARALSKRMETIDTIEYVSIDPYSDRGRIKMDVTDIRFPDMRFDGIICSHVLEHVPDDRKGLSELYRILKPDGWGIIAVPITSDSTYEDPMVVTDEDRLRLYGAKNHVRRYGEDVEDRIQEAGFLTQKISPHEIIAEPYMRISNIPRQYRGIYFCKKKNSFNENRT